MINLPFCRCLSKLFAMPWAAWVVLLAGAGSLATAYAAQYFFDVKPCELCYWQRVPFGLAILLGGLALVSRPYDKRSRVLLGVSSVVFLVGMGLAIFHTGVEQHWWEDIAACSIKPLGSTNVADMSLNDMRDQLLATVGVPCDEITWTFLGLSMANWNILFSLALAVFAGLAACGCCATEAKACRCCCSCTTDKQKP